DTEDQPTSLQPMALHPMALHPSAGFDDENTKPPPAGPHPSLAALNSSEVGSICGPSSLAPALGPPSEMLNVPSPSPNCGSGMSMPSSRMHLANARPCSCIFSWSASPGGS